MELWKKAGIIVALVFKEEMKIKIGIILRVAVTVILTVIAGAILVKTIPPATWFVIGAIIGGMFVLFLGLLALAVSRET